VPLHTSQSSTIFDPIGALRTAEGTQNRRPLPPQRQHFTLSSATFGAVILRRNRKISTVRNVGYSGVQIALCRICSATAEVGRPIYPSRPVRLRSSIRSVRQLVRALSLQ
jgi:hypothetical protein